MSSSRVKDPTDTATLPPQKSPDALNTAGSRHSDEYSASADDRAGGNGRLGRGNDADPTRKETRNVEVNTAGDSDGDREPFAGSDVFVVNIAAPKAPPPPRDFLIGPLLVVLMSFTTLAFTVVSIGVPWYRVRQYELASAGNTSVEGLFYLFKGTWHTQGSGTVSLSVKDLCDPVKTRVRVMEAFAIVSAVMALGMFIASIANVLLEKSNRGVHTVLLVFSALSMGSLTILVSFNFNVYLWSFAKCGPGTSYHSQLYEPYVGFGLTTTAWVITGFAGLIAANTLYIPLDARTVDRSIRAFTCVALIAMMFSVVACPIPHWFYKEGRTRRVTDVLLWRHREGNFDWDIRPPVAAPVLPASATSGGLDAPAAAAAQQWGRVDTPIADLGCAPLIRYFRAAESFSVVSIFFNACAGATGLMLWKSLLGTRLPSLIFAYVGCVMTLVQMALELRLYYGDWCGGMYAYSKQYYVLTAGFALVAAAFCLMFVACLFITVAYVMTEKYFPAMKPQKTAKQILLEEIQ